MLQSHHLRDFSLFLFSAKEKRGINPLFSFGGDSRTLNLALRRLSLLDFCWFSAKRSNASIWEIFRYPYFLHNKNKRVYNPLVFVMVETVELESTTPCMSSKYSNQLSYASVFSLTWILYHKFSENAIGFSKKVENILKALEKAYSSPRLRNLKIPTAAEDMARASFAIPPTVNSTIL